MSTCSCRHREAVYVGCAVAYSTVVAQRQIVYMLSVVVCNVILVVGMVIMGSVQ